MMVKRIIFLVCSIIAINLNAVTLSIRNETGEDITFENIIFNVERSEKQKVKTKTTAGYEFEEMGTFQIIGLDKTLKDNESFVAFDNKNEEMTVEELDEIARYSMAFKWYTTAQKEKKGSFNLSFDAKTKQFKVTQIGTKNQLIVDNNTAVLIKIKPQGKIEAQLEKINKNKQ